uniref:Uncharacterized protein n=1 Tax=Myotis lucifugus TaxID=59463 RepID=G1Q1B9_MYOLU
TKKQCLSPPSSPLKSIKKKTGYRVPVPSCSKSSMKGNVRLVA